MLKQRMRGTGAGAVLAAGELLPCRRAGGLGAAAAALRVDDAPRRRHLRQVAPHPGAPKPRRRGVARSGAAANCSSRGATVAMLATLSFLGSRVVTRARKPCLD